MFQVMKNDFYHYAKLSFFPSTYLHLGMFFFYTKYKLRSVEGL